MEDNARMPSNQHLLLASENPLDAGNGQTAGALESLGAISGDAARLFREAKVGPVVPTPPPAAVA